MVHIGVQKFENRKYKMTPLDMVYVGVQKFKTKSKMTPLDMVQVGVSFKNEKQTEKKKWMENKISQKNGTNARKHWQCRFPLLIRHRNHQRRRMTREKTYLDCQR